MAWWGEGFKRVSDCPLGDEAERKKKKKKKKQDALSPQPPIARLAATQSWEVVEGVEEPPA